jgi:hypothetical protein
VAGAAAEEPVPAGKAITAVLLAAVSAWATVVIRLLLESVLDVVMSIRSRSAKSKNFQELCWVNWHYCENLTK